MNAGSGLADHEVEDKLPRKFLRKVTPHGELVKAFNNVYTVTGSYEIFPFVRMDRTMTMIRTKNKGIVLINAIRVDEKVLDQINFLGQVKHIVRAGAFKGCDDAYYVNKYHDAKYWVCEGCEMNPGIEKHDEILNEETTNFPVPDTKIITINNVKNPECIILLPYDNGGTIITSDIIRNNINPQYSTSVGAKMMEWLGFNQPCTCPAVWRKLNKYSNEVDDIDDFIPNFKRLLEDYEWDNIIPSHGPIVKGDAQEHLLAGLALVWPDHFEDPNAESDDDEDEETKGKK